MDLIKQLRDDTENELTIGSGYACCPINLLHKAADEIERLRVVLKFIADGGDENSDYDQFVWKAKDALLSNDNL